MPPLISVILPTCNRASLLQRAIQSVRSQSDDNFEIVVVDDCSTDDTASVVTSIRDDRLRYLRHETNKGGAAARNTGIRSARGEIIAFLDDDDEWLPEKLERQKRLLGRFDAVICASRIRGKKSIEGHGRSHITLRDLKRGYMGGGTSSLIVRAEVLKHVRFDESLPAGQDWDLLIRIAKQYRVGYLDEALVIYSDEGHARISNKLSQMPISEIQERMRVLYKHRAYLGWYWFNRHAVRMLLYRLRSRPNRFAHLSYAIRRYGAIAVAGFLFTRVSRRLFH